MRSVAVLFSLPIEAKPFLEITGAKMLEHGIYEGCFADTRIYAAISGTVSDTIRTRVQEFLRLGAEHLVIVGFAGALDEGIDSGDIIISDCVIDASRKRLIDVGGLSEHTDNAAADSGLPVRHGPMASTDRVLNLPEHKAETRMRLGCIAVDNETATAATEAAACGLDFLVVRAVVDRLSDTIPREFASCVKEDGTPDIPRLVVSFIKHPRLLRDARRLGRQSKKASRNLARFLISYLRTLPPST